MKPEEIDKAMFDPAAAFAQPEDVLKEPGLTKDDKIEILRRWEFQAAEEAVALEEGMPGEESGMLRRILLALGELTGSLDLEHTAPTKHHALDRTAVKRSD
jgi:hypothetical protein